MIEIIIRASLIAFVLATGYSLKKVFDELDRLNRMNKDLTDIVMEMAVSSFIENIAKKHEEKKEK